MNAVIPYIIAAGVAALIIGAFVLGRVVERKGLQVAVAALRASLATRNEEYSDLLDRFFQTKRLAPQGADLLTRDEEKREEEKQRRAGPRRVAPTQVGSVDRARLQMALAEKRDLDLAAVGQ